MLLNGIDVPAERLAEFCRRYHVRTLAFFGSVLRDDFGPSSDVDVLIEFQPERGPSLLGFAGMQLEMTEMLGREAHLHTPAMLSPHWREQIRREAKVQYAA